jgi:hypothetical protein
MGRRARELASRGRERMMRRIILLLMAMAMTLVVASGVAWAVNKIGTDGPDRLVGTNEADNLVGMGGNDKLSSLRGEDNLLGGPGKDFVIGGKIKGSWGLVLRGGNKNLAGGSGNDIVLGGTGVDNIVGGSGNDFLAQGEGAGGNVLSGGEGNDAIAVSEAPVEGVPRASKDIVTCGAGFDRVLADRKDLVAPDCERVTIGLGVEAFYGWLGTIPRSFFEGLAHRFF